MTCSRRARGRLKLPIISSAARLTLLGIAIFAGSLYLVTEHEAQLSKINWSMVSALCGMGFGAVMFYRWSRDQSNTFDPLDMILDPITRRVSPWRVYLAVLFGAAMWTLFSWVIKDKPGADIIQLITWVGLGLIGKVASGEWADVKANRQPIVAFEKPNPDVDKPGPPLEFGSLAQESKP